MSDNRVPFGSYQVRQRDDNYYVICIPNEIVDHCGLEHGDRVEQVFDREQDQLITRME